MPEAPTLVLVKEDLQPFIGKTITAAEGSSKIDMKSLLRQKVRDIRTWGKHLLLCLDDRTIRVHFLMFGTYLANDHKKLKPRLALKFGKEELNFYTCSVELITEDLDQHYDWSADVISRKWDAPQAKSRLKKLKEEIIGDALLDQEIFSGVGNIIRTEVLYRVGVHPMSKVKDLTESRLEAIVKDAHVFTLEFLRLRRKDELTRNLQVYGRKTCAAFGHPVTKILHAGKTHRTMHICEVCQKYYQPRSKKSS